MPVRDIRAPAILSIRSMRPLNSFYVLAVDVRERGIWEHPDPASHGSVPAEDGAMQRYRPFKIDEFPER